MRKLEEFVTEKLKVTKGSNVPDLISIIESKDREDVKYRCQQLSEYLKNDSNLPIAELEYWQTGLKRLSRKYRNSNDTFLWVQEDGFICYGTWHSIYSVYWSVIHNRVKNFTNGEGFRDFTCNEQELMESKGVFILTENTEFMKQIDILKQKSVPE